MSTTYYDGGGVSVGTFAGGQARGLLVQLTTDDSGIATLGSFEARAIAAALIAAAGDVERSIRDPKQRDMFRKDA